MNYKFDFSNEAVLPKGFRAAGISAGIKKSGVKDMAMIVSDADAAAAGVFTTNKVNAAPVKLCRERLTAGGSKAFARAVIINSGNANACTGAPGLEDARETARAAAKALGISDSQVFVSSTGSIGVRLPMQVITAGVPKAVASLSPAGGTEASEAILTTDTRPKRHHIVLNLGGVEITLTGFCKGAGMIEPNMATMLCYLLTDAAVDGVDLQALLADAVRQSFNRISIDGDMSTNDTVLLLANGAAGGAALSKSSKDWKIFEEAVRELCHRLAIDIVADGEGARKVITLNISGAASDADADKAARFIANSFLIKTSWTGDGVYWGRIMDTLGYSGITIDENNVDIYYDEQPAALKGVAGPSNPARLKEIAGSRAYTISVNLHQGNGTAILYTCECSEEYVRINI